MNLIKNIKTAPWSSFIHSLCRDIKMLGVMSESDKHYIIRKFKRKLGYKPDLKHPKTFQEKLQWIKLNDRKPIYHNMADKVDAKKYITDKLGDKSLCIPTLGVFDRFEDIDFDSLPDEFILKGAHNSGSYYICTDKKTFDKEKAKERLSRNLKYDYFYFSREWPYKGLKHRIIAEPLLHDGTSQYLRDYKFYTFNGEPKFFYITSDRENKDGVREDFFDLEGNLMEFNQLGYYNNPETPALPMNLDKMIEMARILAKDTYHLRVDFYEVNGKVFVGEMTFFDGGGFAGFDPEKYNRILGDWIKLPIDK